MSGFPPFPPSGHTPPEAAHTMSGNLVELSPRTRARFFQATCLGKHSLPEVGLFTDESLAELLDRHPRDRIVALTMGDDPSKPYENQMAIHEGVPGTELLRAVKAGRLWLNVVGVQDSDTRYRELVARLYGELAAQCPGFVPEAPRAALLISSPNALVYYHVDGPPSLLWHVRGRKRVWVYPPLDESLVTRERLEDIFAGASHEYVPYRPDFDAQAEVIDLAPGDMACWPQNAPHRVQNLDVFNVSLSTEHTTAASRRRARVYCANRFLRRKLGAVETATDERGAGALLKAALHRACKALGLDDTRSKTHLPAMRIDPTAPLGCVPLADPPLPRGTLA